MLPCWGLGARLRAAAAAAAAAAPESSSQCLPTFPAFRPSFLRPAPSPLAFSDPALLPPPPSAHLQLTALGFLLGFSYVRSRNLLTPMLIHGAWNGSVLTILFLLASQGVNIQELIHAN